MKNTTYDEKFLWFNSFQTPKWSGNWEQQPVCV